MNKAPDSYLDCKRPPIEEALRLEGDMTMGEATDSLEKKGYFTPRPRPWRLGCRDRGIGRVDFAVLDRFGDVVVEVPSQSDGEFIISAVNSHTTQRESILGLTRWKLMPGNSEMIRPNPGGEFVKWGDLEKIVEESGSGSPTT